MTSSAPLTSPSFKPAPLWLSLILALAAAVSFWFAFSTAHGAAAILIAVPCVCALAKLPTTRQAFYGGLVVGMAMYVPHLAFFWFVFGRAAIPLWLIAGLPIAIFLLLLHLTRRRLGSTWALVLTPVLWTGIEYFRSELYYLRFAWLLPGQAAAFLPGVRMLWLGVYGLGFLYALAAAMILSGRSILRAAGCIALIILAIFMYVPALPAGPSVDAPLHVAGVQLESADEFVIARAL